MKDLCNGIHVKYDYIYSYIHCIYMYICTYVSLKSNSLLNDNYILKTYDMATFNSSQYAGKIKREPYDIVSINRLYNNN